jgi:tetratricopeptide (TPR) repeat protein
MDIVKQNPYRVLGLLGSASERELQKQIAVIKRFSEVGKSKSFDSDFDFIGQVARATEDVQLAASKIEQAHKKVYYALFWFINVNQFDEIAFSNLKNGNLDKAIDVWNKTLRVDVTEKNYSSYQNLSILYIIMAVSDGQLDLDKIRVAVELKGRLIDSDNLLCFFEVVAGNGVSGDKNSIGKIFVDEIIEIVNPYLDGATGIKSSDVISLFSNYPDETKKYVSNKYTEIPLLNIENQIEKAKEKRQQNPGISNEYGKALFGRVKGDISDLSSLLSKDDVHLQMVINKLANELLQCSIGYFNEWHDSDKVDPGDEALEIARYAEFIAPTGTVKNRVDENLATIKEWVDNKQQREKQQRISKETDFISLALEHFNKNSPTMTSIDHLVLVCQSKLRIIKNVLGGDDDDYLNVCDALVVNALGAVIDIFNSTQEQVVNKTLSIDRFKLLVDANLSTLSTLSAIDMSPAQRLRFNKNKQVMVDIKSQVEAAIKKQSGACYIATMAYGDYDHSQVRILRRYRDEVLARSSLGRAFIRVYYTTSPYLVTVLTNKKNINSIIRRLLDKWIKVIK